MQRWTRWQDWVALVAGAYAALSPLWTETEDKATWTMVVLGVVIAAVSLWSLAMPADRISEYGLVLLGVLLVASPWVMGFEDLNALCITAVVTGAVTAIMGLLTVPEISSRMHLTRTAH
jgi:hypothetical protein